MLSDWSDGVLEIAGGRSAGGMRLVAHSIGRIVRPRHTTLTVEARLCTVGGGCPSMQAHGSGQDVSTRAVRAGMAGQLRGERTSSRGALHIGNRTRGGGDRQAEADDGQQDQQSTGANHGAGVVQRELLLTSDVDNANKKWSVVQRWRSLRRRCVMDAIHVIWGMWYVIHDAE